MITKELLDILACPSTKQPLRLASDDELRCINEAARGSNLKPISGDVAVPPMDGALIREDGQVGYAIREDIPILLTEEGFRLPF